MTDPVVPATPAAPVAPAAPAAAVVPPAYPVGPPVVAAALAPLPRRRNVVGIGAFIFGVSGFLSPAIGVVGGFALIGELPNSDGLNFFNLVFFGAIGAGVGCAFGIVAIVLGFVSFAIRNAKRLWGILGLALGFVAVFVGWIPFFAFITTLGNTGTGVPLNG
jgi:hypothetical protein